MERTRTELDDAITWIDDAPRDGGTVEAIVTRPAPDQRVEHDSAPVSAEQGLHGDSWADRGSRQTEDGSSEPARQITLMSSRAIGAITERPQWALAGDQLFVDLDLGASNLPAGTHLEIGTALLRVSLEPHTGCAKFRDRFGADAARWVNAEEHRDRRLRGINASVVRDGEIRVGDVVRVDRSSVTT